MQDSSSDATPATAALCCATWSRPSSWKTAWRPPSPKPRQSVRHVEKMITLGKKGDLHSRRQALSFLMTDKAVKRLFDTVPRATATATAAISASFAPASSRATERRRPSSNSSAPKSSLKSSARSAKTSRPRSAPNSKSNWKNRRRKRHRKAAKKPLRLAPQAIQPFEEKVTRASAALDARVFLVAATQAIVLRQRFSRMRSGNACSTRFFL